MDMLYFFNFVLFIVVSMSLVVSHPSFDTFNYEKQNNYKMRRHLRRRSNHTRRNSFNVFNRAAYPEPLPSSPKPKVENLVFPPFDKIQQGTRMKADIRVYNTKFSYPPQTVGHQIIYREMLDCIITCFMIETEGGVPIILRGGVGYHFFMAVAKAKPFSALTGRIRAYCGNGTTALGMD